MFTIPGHVLVRAVILLIAAVAIPLSALGARAQGLPNLPYILVDADARAVLKENRAFERWHPASLAKLMTAYVTFHAIADGEIQPGSPVTMTQRSTRVPPSRMGYKPGEQLRVDTAITILLVKSANDVAIALGESVAGSVEAFVARMNAAARRLGMEDTHFVNPNGLHDSGQYVSARDMVALSAAVWNEFPQYRNLFETPSISAGGKVEYSYNLLLERFDGATGMKTGFVCAAGYNMVASAERNGRRLVAVVFGAMSQGERATMAAQLLDEGFSMTGGTPLPEFRRTGEPVGPESQRARVCSEEAVKNRYDPLPETAVLKSPYLHERRVTREPVAVSLGGIDADPSPAWMARAFIPGGPVPVPEPRPDYVVVNVDGDAIIPGSLRGGIAVPTPNPAQMQ
jgi:D-alanyl-D-alanine carboxypeptidase